MDGWRGVVSEDLMSAMSSFTTRLESDLSASCRPRLGDSIQEEKRLIVAGFVAMFCAVLQAWTRASQGWYSYWVGVWLEMELIHRLQARAMRKDWTAPISLLPIRYLDVVKDPNQLRRFKVQPSRTDEFRPYWAFPISYPRYTTKSLIFVHCIQMYLSVGVTVH
jgi:hypothetical protein